MLQAPRSSADGSRAQDREPSTLARVSSTLAVQLSSRVHAGRGAPPPALPVFTVFAGAPGDVPPQADSEVTAVVTTTAAMSQRRRLCDFMSKSFREQLVRRRAGRAPSGDQP